MIQHSNDQFLVKFCDARDTTTILKSVSDPCKVLDVVIVQATSIDLQVDTVNWEGIIF